MLQWVCEWYWPPLSVCMIALPATSPAWCAMVIASTVRLKQVMPPVSLRLGIGAVNRRWIRSGMMAAALVGSAETRPGPIRARGPGQPECCKGLKTVATPPC